MPQMAPLLWIFLFMLFSTLFIFSVIKMHFNAPSSPITQDSEVNQTSILMTKNTSNWKW